MAAEGARLGTGYVRIEPDFSRFQEKLGAKLATALAPAGERAGKDLGKNMARGIDRGGFKQAFAPILRRFDKFGDEAGKSIAAKIGKGAKRAEGDMFGLADAVKEVERRSKASSRVTKSLGGDMFGIGKAAKASGKQIHSASSQLGAWHARANSSEKVAKKLGDGIREMGADFSSVVRKLKVGSGDFNGFNGTISRINRSFQFFGNILRTLRLPAFAAAIGLAAQALSALAAGAVAATSALGPLAGLLVALPAGALAAAQAFGVLKLATAGVGDAVKAAVKLQVAGGQQAIDTMRQQEDAAEQVADAERSLADTQRQANVAQTSLNEARKEARRELQDLKLAAEEAHDAEQQGNLSLIQARKDLANTLKDPKATGLDIRFAEEGVDQARNALKQTRLEAKRARQDNADAEKKGVEGNKGVVSAKEGLAEANRSVAAAQRDLTKAIRDQSDAMKDQGSAATALQEKLAELPPAARKFAKFLIGLKPKLDDLRETAAKGFFPGAEKGIKSALKNFGVFKGIVGETSGALGKLAAKAGSKLGSEAWGRDLGKLGALNTRILGRMGDATLNVADAFRNVLVSAEPFLDWLGEGTVRFSEWIKDSSQAGRESGKLEHFFDETRKTMERVWPILKGVGGALLNIGKAAKPLGDEILDSLGKSAEGWRKWTESTEGKHDLRKYFKEVKPAVWAVGRLVRDLSKEFFELGRQRGVSDLLDSVRKFLPTIREAAGALTEFASGFIGQINELREDGLSGFEAFTVALAEHAGEAGVKMAQALVKGFLGAGILGKLAIGAYIVPKLLRARTALTSAGIALGQAAGGGMVSGATSSVRSEFAAGAGAAIGKATPSLKTRFIGLGKTLGYTLGIIGFAGGLQSALSDDRTNGVGDVLHNFSVGFFSQFGLDLGETTGEEFTKGFSAKVGLLAQSGSIGLQSVKTPGVEDRAKSIADAAFPGQGQDMQGTPEWDKVYERALAKLRSAVQARHASAKELFSDFWDDMGPDEKQFARQLRAALVQGDRLVQRTGITVPKIKLETNPQEAAKATKKILSGFDFLKKGIGSNFGDIAKVSKRTADIIRSTFGEGTKEARALAARNMKLTAQAIADQMARSGDVTKKGLDRIKNLFRTADLISPSRKQAEGFGREWAKGMDHTKEVTAEGIQAMIGEAQKMPGPMRKIALETWLDQAKAAQRSGDLTTDAFRKMRSKVFAEFGQIQASGKTFNKEFAKGFVDMVNNSGGAMGILMTNVSNLLGTLGKQKKLNWKILNAKLGKDPNGASLGRQKGGPVPTGFALGGLAATVPGNSTGDRHVLSLNGRPVAKVESREGIFVGNRKMMGAVSAANDAVPRFQTGGAVRGGLGPEPKLEGQAGSLKRLGQAAISKVYEGAKDYLGKQKGSLGAAGGGGPLGSMGASGSVAGHPELQPGISAIVATILRKFPGLAITSTTGGGHAVGSYHYSGRAADLGASSDYMLRAAAWIRTHLGGNLAEGIHNPNLSVDSGHEVSPSFWGASTWADHLDHIHVAKQRGGLLGSAARLLKGFASGGYVGDINHTWAEHNSGNGDWGGPTLPPYVIAALAEAAGKVFNPAVPGWTMEQITKGESAGRPGSSSADHGYGLWAITAPYNDAIVSRYGGYKQMLNPVKNAAVMAQIFNPSTAFGPIWHGDSFVTSRTAHYDGNYDISNALGGASFKEALEGKHSGSGETEGGTKEVKKPVEKVPPNYGGVSTGPIHFGQPKTLEQVNAELNKLVGNDGKGGLAKMYRQAAKKADKESKPETAKALRKNLHIIEQRVAGLRSMRTKLRIAKAKKTLTEGISKKLSKLAGYDQRIDGSQRSYEVAAQFAEQVVGLEPESPEIAAEPEVEQRTGETDKAFEKRRRDSHNAYEQQREGIEKDYVARYSAYIEGQERPAYQSVLERIAGWRNTILRAETFGFGKGEPSANQISTTWESGVRKADHGIDRINTFTEAVKKRVEEYRDKVKREVSDWRAGHKGETLPKWLKERQDHLPDWLQGQVDKRDRLRSNVLPRLLDKDSQLRTAIGEARESFFAGGENRIGPNGAGIPKSDFAKRATLPSLPLPGSGSFEERLQDVQGLHIYPEQHELLGADALAGPNQPGQFGGVIWDVRESIKELGLKIKQATSSVQKASFEKPGNEEEDKADDSERVALLEGLLREANQRTLVSETLGRTISQFNAAYPFAGTFHTGGVIPGPSNAESLALVRGREAVLTPEQMEGLSSETAGGLTINSLKVQTHGDGYATVDIDGQQFRRKVEEINRSTNPLRGRSAVR